MLIDKTLNKAYRAWKPVFVHLRGNDNSNCTCSICEEMPKKRPFWQKALFFVALIGVLFVGSCSIPREAHAAEYTNEQIVNAIRKAEGTWTYGIKTVKCQSESICRATCLRTVRNNRRRFARIGHRSNRSFIQFLASRYCPTTGRNLTASEKRLNGNWLKNVTFFLERGA